MNEKIILDGCGGVSASEIQKMCDLTESVRQTLRKFYVENNDMEKEDPFMLMSIMSYACLINAVNVMSDLKKEDVKDSINGVVERFFAEKRPDENEKLLDILEGRR